MNMIRYQQADAGIPVSAMARLPASYEAAKQALANCEQIDECVSWADKAAALASYAKMANDDELEKRSTRIRARAIRRAGELLKQIGGKGNNQHTDATDSKLTQAEVARSAGMSERQQVQAVRVASVPDQSFEAQIESESPPTVTKLAEQGKKAAPRPAVDLKGRDPGDFNRCLHFVAEFESYHKVIQKLNIDQILPVLSDPERMRIRSAIAAIDAFHDRIMTRI